MLKISLFGEVGVPGNVLRGADNRLAIELFHLDAAIGEDRHFHVVHENDVSRILQNRRYIRSKKVFAFAYAHNERWSVPHANDLVRFFRTENRAGINAMDLFKGFSDRDLQIPLVKFFNQMRYHFRIGFRDEAMTF